MPTPSLSWLTPGPGFVHTEDMRSFMNACLRAVGVPSEHAALVAGVLVAADCRGHSDLGFDRLGPLVRAVKEGRVDARAQPRVLRESAASAWVDGRNAPGPVVADFCMRLAVKKAAAAGAAWVSAKGSNDFGSGACYADIAAQAGLLGLAMSNGPPAVAPFNGREPFLGVNPLAAAMRTLERGICGSVPGKDGLDLEIATSAARPEEAPRWLESGQGAPPGRILDSAGQPLEGAGSLPALSSGKWVLAPLAGQKGYALGGAVEVLAGVLAGARSGPRVRPLEERPVPADLGQSFVAVAPACFCPGGGERLMELLGSLRGLQPAQADVPVLVPGDPERASARLARRSGGVSYRAAQLHVMARLAAELRVKRVSLL